MFPVKQPPPACATLTLSMTTLPNPSWTLSPQGEALLLAGGEALGLELQPFLPQFARLYVALQEGSSRMNLTALKTEEDIVTKHFLDSLTCAHDGHLQTSGRVFDLGTGAGFPTLPLAIVYPLNFVAMDATRKKVEHVAWAAQQTGLDNVTTLVGRAEALGRDPAHREQYQRVVTRAVAALPILAELALPLLEVGGLLIAQKGPITAEELQAGGAAASALGGEVVATERFNLPLLGDPRSLVVVRKVKPTPAKYPRREGVPNKEPLFWKAK